LDIILLRCWPHTLGARREGNHALSASAKVNGHEAAGDRAATLAACDVAPPVVLLDEANVDPTNMPVLLSNIFDLARIHKRLIGVGIGRKVRHYTPTLAFP